MLVLSRREGEVLMIGDDIRVQVFRLANGRVTIGVHAPDDVKILRGEIAVDDSEPQQPDDRRPAA